MASTAAQNSALDYDVLIVGAGISGIGMAAHMKMHCPQLSYGIVEMRENLGGTWDLFKYPGIRSDSDMHTLGFVFEPWKHEKTIADAPSIMDYLNKIVDERGIRENIRFGHKVTSTDFSSADGCWNVVLETSDGERKTVRAGFLYLGSGYYDYDDPYDAGFDTSAFKGEVIHPQFWPEDLDYTGKKVVVVGSGATSVTIVPSMADKAEHVTMLQRTPTWMWARPAKDWFANTLRKILPEETAYKITRFKNIRMQDFSFKMARNKPETVKGKLKTLIQKSLGDNYDEATFTPPYDPWDQRVCLVPDDDLFNAMNAGKASIVTDHIDAFEADGVRLKSGKLLEADIIITATGLSLAFAGKIDIAVDGERVDFAKRFYYMSCMFSNVPNLAAVFGYLNASWTLRADIVSEYTCRVLNHMDKTGSAIAVAVMTPEEEAAIEEDDIFDFSSGYIQRGKHLMPRNAMTYPWRLAQEYVTDRKVMQNAVIGDGKLTFRPAGNLPTQDNDEQLEAAE